MFKYDNNTLPKSISKLFVPNTAIHTYNTRNKHNLRPKQSKWVYIMYKKYILLTFIYGMIFKNTSMFPCPIVHSNS